MVFKNLQVIVLCMAVDLALEGLTKSITKHILYECLLVCDLYGALCHSGENLNVPHTSGACECGERAEDLQAEC